jgi:predicted CoA-binding protein
MSWQRTNVQAAAAYLRGRIGAGASDALDRKRRDYNPRMTHTNPTPDHLRQILSAASTIAIVGASGKPDKPSYGVMQTLQRAGFKVVPVNPREAEILGERSYPTLTEVPGPIDVVDVFRRPEDTPAIADEAVAVGAKTLWLQAGIASEDAAARAARGGLSVVMNTCIGQTVRALGVTRRPPP